MRYRVGFVGLGLILLDLSGFWGYFEGFRLIYLGSWSRIADEV